MKQAEKVSNIKLFQQNQNVRKYDAIHYHTTNTLSLNRKGKHIENDNQFLQDIKSIAYSNNNIFENIAMFTKQKVTDDLCDEIDYIARLHSQANTVNNNTLKNNKDVQKQLVCICGCGKIMGRKISLFASQQQMETLGPGLLLLFLFIKWIIVMLIGIILIYGIFSIICNAMGNQVDISDCDSYYCRIKIQWSDQNKFNRNLTQIIQQYLGILWSVLWVVMVRVVLHLGKRKIDEFDDRFKTASDFTIKIQNLPYGKYQQNELIEYLDKLWKRVIVLQQKQTQNAHPNKQPITQQDIRFGIKSIQIIYNVQVWRNITQQIRQSCDEIYNMLEQNDTQEKSNIIKGDGKDYLKLKNKIIQSYQLLKDLRKMFLNQNSFRRNLSTTCCLVQFNSFQYKNQILKYFGKSKSLLSTKIINTIQSILFSKTSNLLFKGNAIHIERAPQPSDIIWQNCEVRYSLLRILVIYFATFMLILVSFGLITFISSVSPILLKLYDGLVISLVINYSISISLRLMNKLLWASLYYLLQLEYNHTLTQKIVSLMDKALFATSINIIVLPIISYYIIKGKLYGNDGLSGYVFEYHIYMVTISLITKLMQPMLILKQIALNIRSIRNSIIKYLCGSVAVLKIQKGVPSVNKFYQNPKFDISDAYVTILGTLFHAAFFMQLQPITLIIFTFMLCIFYMVVKYKVLRTCSLPQMTDFMIFENAIKRANYVPILYGIGSLSISIMAYQKDPSKIYNHNYAIICCAIGAFGVIDPWKIISRGIERLVNNFYSRGNKEQLKNKRQSYYIGCNSLNIFGFENFIQGGSGSSSIEQLKKFCERFQIDSNNQNQEQSSTSLNKQNKFLQQPQNCLP